MPDPVRILLVEDEEGDAELAQRALAKTGLPGRIHLARDGEEALDFVFGRGEFEGRPGLSGLRMILLDLKLPKVDGLEVLQQLRSDPRTRCLPVVILTSSMLASDVDACYRAGANSFVVKRVEFDMHSRVLGDIARYWLTLNVAL
jgi:CheY-like chemotaxis protein